MKYYYVML